jgi:FtsP/CotA-like multicopper oxidase with cupredoxin domain
MSWNAFRALCLLTVVVFVPSFSHAVDQPSTIATNDNRSPGGQLRDGKLELSLELGEGRWFPEGDGGRAITIYAFGEAGRPLQNPGPLIRVPQGTEIHITLRNTLPITATVHGLHERPGSEKDALVLQSGATQEVRFKVGVSGTYYYWASTTGSAVAARMPVESQLAGAFIVDPPDTVPTDRIFVVGVWYKEIPFRAAAPQLATINGKSWPYTERFTFQQGETVRWRWLNPSVMNHGMHLHGFFYNVEGTGDGERYRAYAEGKRPLIVTQYMDRGETFDMTWTPERPGRWLFHCHMMMHMLPPQWRMLVDAPEQAASATHVNEHSYSEEAESAGMGGLVLGITVVNKTRTEITNPPVWRAERKLQLIIDERTGTRPRYALQLREPERSQPGAAGSTSAQLIGPPIVLNCGEPVEIEVVNHSTEPTAIHWHGIELESYYDGVAGWTGTGQETTPAIQPGKSFLVRMTPPRAGTFIYHTHWHDQDQMENALYGPLIVVPKGQKLDAASDKVFLFSAGVFDPLGQVILINGHPQPSPLRLLSGTRYRFRLINISADHVGMMVSLRKAGVPVEWRIVAKDGADLPPASVAPQTAEMRITVGETYDVEYQAGTPQELALEVYLPGPKLRVTQALMFAAGSPTNSSSSTN